MPRHPHPAITVALLASPAIWASPVHASPAEIVSKVPRPFDVAAAEALLGDFFDEEEPGIGVLIVQDGRTLLSREVGLADTRMRVPITVDTVFPLGSITKQFTAAVILQMVAEGRLALADPLSKFFPEWPQPAARATIAQLLGHSSGIADYSKVPGWIQSNRDREFTTAELLEVMRPLGSKVEPGEEFEYNNGGYALLGAIVETVAGRSWQEEMRARLLEPLGLDSIRMGMPADGGSPIARGHAIDDGRLEIVPQRSLSIAGASGGLVGTLADLARWNAALHGGKVLRPDLYAAMTSPGRLNNGSKTEYGYGLRIRSLRGRDMLMHGGSLAGYRLDAAWLPDSKTFLGVFSNNQSDDVDGTDVLLRLGAMAIGDPVPVFTQRTPDPAAVEPFLGEYRVEGSATSRIFLRDGDTYYLAIGDIRVPLAYAGQDRFYRTPEGLTWFDFDRFEDGTPRMRVTDVSFARPIVARRTGDVPVPVMVPEALRTSYVGRYQTETVALAVVLEKGRLWMVQSPDQRMPLRAVTPTRFAVEGTPMFVEFVPSDGRTDAFVLHRGARQLHGKRIAE